MSDIKEIVGWLRSIADNAYPSSPMPPADVLRERLGQAADIIEELNTEAQEATQDAKDASAYADMLADVLMFIDSGDAKSVGKIAAEALTIARRRANREPSR